MAKNAIRLPQHSTPSPRPATKSGKHYRQDPLYRQSFGRESTLQHHAKRLGIATQTLADWLCGKNAIPQAKKAEVLAILNNHNQVIERLRNRLFEAPAGARKHGHIEVIKAKRLAQGCGALSTSL